MSVALVRRGDTDNLKKFILHFGIDIANMSGTDGYTALQAAIDNNSVEMVEILLDAEVDPNTYNMFGITPLYKAISGANPNIVKLLIYYPLLNLKDRHNDTSLYQSIYDNNLEIATILLDGGIDPFVTGLFVDDTPFGVARERGCTKIVELIENYLPSFQVLTRRCIRDNKISISSLPRTIRF